MCTHTRTVAKHRHRRNHYHHRHHLSTLNTFFNSRRIHTHEPHSYNTRTQPKWQNTYSAHHSRALQSMYSVHTGTDEIRTAAVVVLHQHTSTRVHTHIHTKQTKSPYNRESTAESLSARSDKVFFCFLFKFYFADWPTYCCWYVMPFSQELKSVVLGSIFHHTLKLGLEIFVLLLFQFFLLVGWSVVFETDAQKNFIPNCWWGGPSMYSLFGG